MCSWQPVEVAQPSPAQAEAGNYTKGHLRWAGFDVSIETPKGSTRKARDGSWEVKDMPAHYGYLRGTEGADGGQVDVYLGGHPEEDTVYVVDQVDADTGKFDEHKVMAGFKSEAQAVKAYHRGFSDGKGPDRLGAITAVSLPHFKSWVRSRAARMPFVKLDTARRENTQGFMS